ncbi:MAG: bifunctional demethylmenaquinone methyltransferase/2-methoxy-6-polyprenyl-1,4-benzoquinol methylase UbiE [Thermodesulfovibrionales bacterium]
MNRDEFIKKIFSIVAPHIDFLSTFLSFGFDNYWRRKVISYINPGEDVLDVCTGTGRLALLISKKLGRYGSVKGIDINDDMLQVAIQKIKNNPGNLSFLEADSMDMPFQSQSFDVVTVAFGIRNVSEPLRALRECHRVLKNGGRLLCLDLMKPENRFFIPLWKFYVFKIIPLAGRLVVGDPVPYKYLPASIEGFYNKGQFLQLLKDNGFKVLEVRSLTCGTVNLFVAEKRKFYYSFSKK